MKPALSALLCVILVIFSSSDILIETASADPDFGPNVFIFRPDMPMDTIQGKVSEIFSQQERSQFGPDRYAFLFHPGEYKLDVNVGFYTEVLGLGLTPDAVSITGQVHSEADWMRGNATCTFWRSVAGIAVTPDGGTDRWATSQATPFRRMHIKGNLVLFDGGWSSGGFISDSRIDGTIISGSQQQYFLRNTYMGKWNGGNWNMVFVGDVNPPEGAWPKRPYTVVSETPMVREKPFLFVDENDNYAVRVPEMRKDSTSITWENGPTPGTDIPIDRFFIAHAGTDNAATMNTALLKQVLRLHDQTQSFLG